MRALALLLAVCATAAQACPGRDAPCEIDGGTYRIVLPEGAAPAPAVVFLHGFGGSGAGVLRQTGMVSSLTARGWAVIAPDGRPRQGRNGLRWSFDGAEGRTADAFLRAVAADAAARHGVDAGRMVLAGFSNGAFMVTYLACRDPEAFAAYAPLSGGFWEPQPERCAGPVRLLQTHGWRDPTVPLEGRPLGGGRRVQGDIFAGLQLWRETNGCQWDDPEGYATTGQFMRRRWDCGAGSALEMALFPGGHGVPDGWADLMLDWFEALPD
ncbi:alpha/beta hydrolase family esterase [Jannaschia ovalis]|uniref:PHB depolymerase family esterase n=1 Tax=Jannaschia ovalis TaxID=3038773 RepID=A0ABY8LEX3_9RHOB|nr:alpha/beta fold hydrolase [Jannaschia sp. GRR-S6-38]WGH78635.1 PHB depolymerase family esterase [Jannaschia sp. GRR-S6-38]